MAGQKAQETINLSIRIGSFFLVLFLLLKLFPVRFEMPGIKWFRNLKKHDEKVVFEAFSASRSAMLAGFSEHETLSLFQKDFFLSYAQAISVLGASRRETPKNPAAYLAYLALFAAGQGAPGQRHAAIKAFFRYYPDVIDDPSLMARVVFFLGGREGIINDFQAEADLRQAVWRVAAIAIERIRASGGADFSELSVLEAIYPEIENLLVPVVSVEEELDGEGGNAAKGAAAVEDVI